jgi:predicted porin
MASFLLATISGPVAAAEDVKALLELLMEKGIITREEYDKKIKKAQEIEEVRAFNEAQDVRRANAAIDKRVQDEAKFKTEIYGQLSAGYYQASNMTAASIDASGMSDQPKANNRVGLKVSRELAPDLRAMVTLESNFSARTGAIGRDAAGYGVAATGNAAAVFDREANVRAISASYGTLILGRGPTLQNDLSSAFDARQNWNFGGLKAIGRYVGFHSASGVNRADKLIRYISPAYEGFTLDTAISFGGVADDADKGTNYYLGGRYKNGNVEFGYNHAEVKLGSASAPTSQTEVTNRVDFFAAKYTVDSWTVNAGYVMTRNPSLSSGGSFDTLKTSGKVNADTWFAGAVYRFTPKLSWNGGWYQVVDQTVQTNANRNNDVTMVATGLTWSPYKELDLFVDYAQASRQSGATGAFTLYDKWVPDTGTGGNASSSIGYSESKKNQSGISVGALYRF